MKKKMMIAMTTLIAVGLLAGLAWACTGYGYHGGWGWNGNPGYSDNTGQNYQQFNNETATLREELAGKRGEYNALMVQDNPDPKRAAQLQKEITRLHDQIQSKAQAYDMPPQAGAYNNAHRGATGWGYCGGWCW